jgi:hypothetical protein
VLPDLPETWSVIAREKHRDRFDQWRTAAQRISGIEPPVVFHETPASQTYTRTSTVTDRGAGRQSNATGVMVVRTAARKNRACFETS